MQRQLAQTTVRCLQRLPIFSKMASTSFVVNSDSAIFAFYSELYLLGPQIKRSQTVVNAAFRLVTTFERSAAAHAS